MSRHTRREVLAGLATLAGLSGLSGCSLSDRSGSVGSRTTESGVFTDLTVETEETWCPADSHWEPAHHRTPAPPPAKPSDLTRETVVEYVGSYEAHVLTYLAVAELGPQTPPSPTAENRPAVPAFPDAEIRDDSTTVLTALEDRFVAQITYTRVVEGESRGRYTVNYHVAPETTIRAEAAGEVSPGPNPAKSGRILDC